jgi:hypothetical protein
LNQERRNETVEKGQFLDFSKNVIFENQRLTSSDFWDFGFFDGLNNGVQATANSVRLSLAPAARRARSVAFGMRSTRVERRDASNSGHGQNRV